VIRVRRSPFGLMSPALAKAEVRAIEKRVREQAQKLRDELKARRDLVGLVRV
jgi:hypothetical protein